MRAPAQALDPRVAPRFLSWAWSADDGVEALLLLGGAAFDGDLLEQRIDHVVGRHAVGLGVEVGDDAVAEDGLGDRADVVGGDVEAALEDGAGLGREDEVLAGARACAPGEVFLDELGDDDGPSFVI